MDAERSASRAPQIHPTAAVDRTAELGPGVTVGPFAVVGPGVVIGSGTVLHAHAVVEPGVTLGRDNALGVGVVLGCRPQHRRFNYESSTVVIGDGNVFGEYATVSRGFGEDATTVVGNDGYFMSYAHIGHDCRIGNGVTVVSGVGLAGYVRIDDGAYVGGNSGVHQFVRVGRLAMIAGMSMVRQDVPPFILVAGVPARAHSLNVVGLRRADIAHVHRQALRHAFSLLYLRDLTISAAIDAIAAESSGDPYVEDLLAFLRGGDYRRGIVRWTRARRSD